MILRHETQEINIIDTNVVHSLRSHHFFHVTPFLYRKLSKFCRCDETSTLDQWFCSSRWRHVGVGNLLSVSSNSRTSDCWVVLKFPEDFWDAVWIEHRQGWGCTMKWRTKCGRPKLIFFCRSHATTFLFSRYCCRCPQDDHRPTASSHVMSDDFPKCFPLLRNWTPSPFGFFKAWQTPGLELGIRVSNASFASRDVRWEDKDRSEKGAKWPSVWWFWMVLVISDTEVIHVGVQVESFRMNCTERKSKKFIWTEVFESCIWFGLHISTLSTPHEIQVHCMRWRSVWRLNRAHQNTLLPCVTTSIGSLASWVLF